MFDKRTLARKPFFEIKKLDPFPGAYTKYFNDHFPLQPALQKQYTLFNYFILDKSPRPDYVNIGKNKWLYLVPREKTLYTGDPVVDNAGIKKIGLYLKERAEWHAKRGIKFYVAFPPIKPEIYPENNPSSFIRGKDGTVTDRIINELKKYPEINFIDLKTALLRAKPTGLLYCAKDNHWNSRGAFVAYKAIITRIKMDFPRTGRPAEGDVTFRDTVVQYGLPEIFNLQDYLGNSILIPTIKNARAKLRVSERYTSEPPEGYYETIKETNDPALPKAIIFRDSFTINLMPFLDENFCRTDYVFDKWNYDFHKSLVEKEKPDLVILLVNESTIYNLADGK